MSSWASPDMNWNSLALGLLVLVSIKLSNALIKVQFSSGSPEKHGTSVGGWFKGAGLPEDRV